MKRNGFTLIELLVVVAIIGILAAVGVVAYNGYTSAAKVAVVKNNHKLAVSLFKRQLTMCEVGEQIETWDDNSKKIIKKDCGNFEQNANWIFYVLNNDPTDVKGGNPFDSNDGEGKWWWNKNIPSVANKGRVACAYDNSIGPGGIPAIRCSARYGDGNNDYVETFIYPN